MSVWEVKSSEGEHMGDKEVEGSVRQIGGPDNRQVANNTPVDKFISVTKPKSLIADKNSIYTVSSSCCPYQPYSVTQSELNSHLSSATASGGREVDARITVIVEHS